AAIVLVYTPPRVAVTSTVTVHEPAVTPVPAGMLRVAGSVMAEPPAAAPTAPAPPQLVVAFGVAAITTPAGSVSVSVAVSAAADVLLLVSVIVSVDVPPAAIVAGAKALATVGAAAFTVRFALAAAALLPLPVCRALAAIVL